MIGTPILIFSRALPDSQTFSVAYVPSPKISNLGLVVSLEFWHLKNMKRHEY